jgi:hypothetical protein
VRCHSSAAFLFPLNAKWRRRRRPPRGRKWKPSPKLLVLAKLLPLLPGEKTPVQFQVTSVGFGTWWVDDFFVDPKCR